jgi:hypothetical protein
VELRDVEVSAALQEVRDRVRPHFEIVEPPDRAARGVDEVELAREVLAEV